MKRVKIALTSLTLALALTGVMVVKANEKKRSTTTIGFFANSAGVTQITLNRPVFDDAGINFQASIKDDGNIDKPIYKVSALNTPLRLIP